MKRPDTTKLHFEQRIPRDIIAKASGRKLNIPLAGDIVSLRLGANPHRVRLSLRTTDPREYKARSMGVQAYLESVWQALRKGQDVPLTQRQAVALSRELYAIWAAHDPRETAAAELDETTRTFRTASPSHGLTDPDEWDAVNRYLDGNEDDPEKDLGPLVDLLLMRKGIASIDGASRSMVLQAFAQALRDGIAHRKREAEGDYRPDPKAERFPEWTTGAAKVSMMGLVEDWWKEAKQTGRSQSTYAVYKGAMQRLSDFAKHDDAARLTKNTLVDYKSHRLAEGISAKTIADTDLASLRSVFGWAVDNLKLPFNPVDGVRIQRPKVTKTRSKGFTAEEAALILSHAAAYKPSWEKTHGALSKRWVPWLCAYTGARVGEILQLRKQDVRQEGEHHVIHITPEAGTVKDKTARDVVVHEHLIERGFLDFVRGRNTVYLFLEDDAMKRDVHMALNVGRNRMALFVRQVVKDNKVSPNHGWRHAFKTVCREVGIADTVSDAITGHSPDNIGGAYGDVTLPTIAAAIAKFPRYAVSS